MVSIYDEFQNEGAVLLRGALETENFYKIDSILENHWKQFAIGDPYGEKCAEFAMGNSEVVTDIYRKVADLNECIELARTKNLKAAIKTILGENAKIYNKIPLRIDVPLETKELAVWHQDDFYVQGAPNEVTAWIPLQDTPMHLGALSVIKKSHLNGKIDHDIRWAKKYMPIGVYDLPINIIEMKKGDVLLFNSFTLHTSNINFSNLIRYSVQIRFTSEKIGEPSKIMGELHDL